MGANNNRAFAALFILGLLVAFGLSLTALIFLAVFAIQHVNPGALIAGILLVAVLYQQNVPPVVRRVVAGVLEVPR